MDRLSKSCEEYLAAQDRLKSKVQRLQGKTLRLARISDSWR